nr:hypothetical protein L204_05123 [Cryptococcus depauperatus CBS 7855]
MLAHYNLYLRSTSQTSTSIFPIHPQSVSFNSQPPMSLPSDPCRPYESNEEPKAGDGRSSGSVSHTSSRPPHPIVFENQTGYKTPYSSRPPDDLGKSSIASDPSNVPMDQSALGGN